VVQRIIPAKLIAGGGVACIDQAVIVYDDTSAFCVIDIDKSVGVCFEGVDIDIADTASCSGDGSGGTDACHDGVCFTDLFSGKGIDGVFCGGQYFISVQGKVQLTLP